MLGRSRCAQTQHEMRITRLRGVVPGNEVERRENWVAQFAAMPKICQPWRQVLMCFSRCV